MTRAPTRRRLLRTIGVATTATFAGCSSSGDDETTSAGTTGNERTTETAGTATGTASTETETASDTTTGTTSAETTGKQTTGTAPPKDGGDVRFFTENGGTVQGTLLGDGECGIVFAHGVEFDRKSWLPQAKHLADEGYTCLTIDLNLDDRSTTPEYVLAAVRYLRRRVGVKNVVLIGASAGANAVVRANARANSGSVDGTLALSPGDGVDAAAKMQGWKLFVVSRGDDEFVQTAKRMHDVASNPKRLEMISGSSHGQAVFEENENAIRSAMNSLLQTVCG